MRSPTALLGTTIVLLMSPAASIAQSTQPPRQSTSMWVPPVINISGTFRPADGQKPARVEVVALAIYAEEAGGERLINELLLASNARR